MYKARRIIVAVLMCMCLPMLIPAALIGQSNSQKTTTKVRVKKDSIPEIGPQIPKANRNVKHRVFLEGADRLIKNEYQDSIDILIGNVKFSHGPMLMFCDSARFNTKNESLYAFGNVKMQQGDTLFVYGDELNYFGDKHIAILYGLPMEPVRMINRDVTLKTPEFIYDLALDYGYYYEWGELTDKENILTSIEGEYIPSTKEANFYNTVRMTSRSKGDTLTIETDTLYYNTNTHEAQLVSPSTIINADATIYTSDGIYNTDNGLANLFSRSKVIASTGTILEGDTLVYDRDKGYGEAFGNMVIDDTTHCMILTGDYGYYNELVDSAFATGRALAREYSQGDTLYLHGKYLYSFTRIDTVEIKHPVVKTDSVVTATDSIHASIGEIATTDSLPTKLEPIIETRIDTSYVMVAHPRVRFYRSDMQGICDSMRFEQRDSMLYMYHHPIVWSGERQIFGNEIHLHLNDSTIEKAILPDFGFCAEHIEGPYYNQLAGKEMIAYFIDGDLRKLDVNGNVQAIMLPQENDSTYNKIVNVESSFLTADFFKQEVLKMKMWPQTNGRVTPLYLSSKKQYKLDKFQWYISMRPDRAEDVLTIPDEMESLMADIPASTYVPPISYQLYLQRQKEAEEAEESESEDQAIEATAESDMIDSVDSIEDGETDTESESEANSEAESKNEEPENDESQEDSQEEAPSTGTKEPESPTLFE